MEHVPFIIKNTSQNPIEFNFYPYHPNDYATWRFSADRDISNIDWKAVKGYEEINTIAATAKTFRLMPGEAISLRNVSKVGTEGYPRFNIEDKGLLFDGSLLSLLPGGKMTKGCFSETFSFCIGLTETPSFSDISEVPKDAFSQMFEGCTNLEKTAEITAKKFGYNACDRMFKDCTSLKNAADMPNAKELDERAFWHMYDGCKSLTEMKPLPASRVGAFAYAGMFEGCTNLEKTSEITAKEFGRGACERMFEGCTSLKNAADMPNAKELDTYAFWRMYYGCTSLTEIPDCPNVDKIPDYCFYETYANSGVKKMKPLPATKVGHFAYAHMFEGCTNLEKASEIAAKEFGKGACGGMFKGCTSLTEMKPLPAYRVGYKAYEGMFMGCTSLEKASEIAAKEFGGSACDRMFKDCTSLKKPANMPNCKNTFEDMYAGCPLQPEIKRSKNNTKGSKANLKHPILTQGKAKGQSKGLK